MKKNLKNKWSEWICQKSSALFTLLLSVHGEPEPLCCPAQRETGRSGSPVSTSGFQLETEQGKRRGQERRGGREEAQHLELLSWWKSCDDTWRTSTKWVASVSNYHALLSDRGRWWKCPRCVNDSIVLVTTYSVNVVNDCSISQSCMCCFLKTHQSEETRTSYASSHY